MASPNPLSVNSDSVMIAVDTWARNWLSTGSAGANAIILNTGVQNGRVFNYEDGDYSSDFGDYDFSQVGANLLIRLTDALGNVYTDVPDHYLLLQVDFDTT